MSGERPSVLVAGASEFIGRRLVATLTSRGHRVGTMPWPADNDQDLDALATEMAGVEAAVYLAPTPRPGSEPTAAEAARRFGSAAAQAGVRQIVYLGALGGDESGREGELSPPLRARRELEGLLGSAGVAVTVLRAAIVVGAGGTSWEMTRQLVRHLPAMLVPRWADTRTQPIAVDDVISYLVGVIGDERAYGKVYEIGGADQLTYVQMLQQAAEVINGRRVPIVTLPVLTPRLSSLWIGLVTNLDSAAASDLIDSMSTEAVRTDYAINEIVALEPLSYREAVSRAVAEESSAD